MGKEKVRIYYAIILEQDDNSLKLSQLEKDKAILEKLYPKAKIVEVIIAI